LLLLIRALLGLRVTLALCPPGRALRYARSVHPGEDARRVRTPAHGGASIDRVMTTEPTSYRIIVRGRLSDRFADSFDGLAITSAGGTTVLAGELRDATALWGVLNRLRDLGIELVRLEEVEA
jgi:hypothetical protein